MWHEYGVMSGMVNTQSEKSENIVGWYSDSATILLASPPPYLTIVKMNQIPSVNAMSWSTGNINPFHSGK